MNLTKSCPKLSIKGILQATQMVQKLVAPSEEMVGARKISSQRCVSRVRFGQRWKNVQTRLCFFPLGCAFVLAVYAQIR